MKIDAVRAFKVTGPADVPAIEERSSQQIDIYPEFTDHERSSHKPGAPLSAIYIEIGTDEGVTGLFGPLFEETAFIVVRKLRPWLLGQNPLVGANDGAIGPRFPDLSEVYDAGLRAQLARIAGNLGIALASGVYVAVLGPSFETPAEIRALRTLGADLVGMSTVPEAISARHTGLRVVGLSVVTNLAAGLAAAPLSHAETLAQASAAATKLAELLRAFCREVAHA